MTESSWAAPMFLTAAQWIRRDLVVAAIIVMPFSVLLGCESKERPANGVSTGEATTTTQQPPSFHELERVFREGQQYLFDADVVFEGYVDTEENVVRFLVVSDDPERLEAELQRYVSPFIYVAEGEAGSNTTASSETD